MHTTWCTIFLLRSELLNGFFYNIYFSGNVIDLTLDSESSDEEDAVKTEIPCSKRTVRHGQGQGKQSNKSNSNPTM